MTARSSIFCLLIRLLSHSLQPYFAPIGINTPGAEQSIRGIGCPTINPLKNHAIIGQLHHLSSPFVDDLRDAAQHFGRLAAIWDLLSVEPQSSIPIVLIQGV